MCQKTRPDKLAEWTGSIHCEMTTSRKNEHVARIKETSGNCCIETRKASRGQSSSERYDDDDDLEITRRWGKYSILRVSNEIYKLAIWGCVLAFACRFWDTSKSLVRLVSGCRFHWRSLPYNLECYLLLWDEYCDNDDEDNNNYNDNNCKQSDETVEHIISACAILAKEQYIQILILVINQLNAQILCG